MNVSRILRASHYKPSIHFLGRRPQGTGHAAPPAPHPAAPKDLISSSPFLSSLSERTSEMRPPTDASSGYSGHHQAPAPHSVSQPSGSGAGQNSSSPSSSQQADKTEGPISSKPADFENFWEAPSYLWMPREMTERESEAVMSGGATDIRSGP